ncbi:MAG: DUF3791 domain-containing protein [Clostridiales bacterium]|nr:DUF3791 domain-containing protein [Clostridiales bacterium]
MTQEQIAERMNVTDMQCRIFRMAEKKWGLAPEVCADIFRQYDIFGFIDECYDSLHLNSYQCALDDVETLLHNQGVDI